ncbi:MAG: thioredoxin family protein [Bacteroidales bacterium]
MNSIKNLIGEAPIALVYFYSEDCAPCLTLRQKIRELIEQRFSNIPFILLDGKNYPELMQEHLIVSFPAALLFAEGREFRRYGLYSSIHSMADDLERLKQLIAE